MILALLIAPMALVWPRSWARLLVPKRTRPALARRPQLWTWVIALSLAAWSALGAKSWLLGGPAASGPLDPTLPLTILYGVFGGLSLVAFTRAFGLVGREWAVTYAATGGAAVRVPVDAGAALTAAEPADVLRSWGFRVSQPGGEWSRGFAPAAFMSGQLVVGPSLWPWAAAGDLDGRPVLFAQQRGQVRHPTGVTTTRTRTVCAVQLTGTQLPSFVVSALEQIPATRRAGAVDLQLVSFDRSLWAWATDLHGRDDALDLSALASVLWDLPEGASVRFDGDSIAVYSDETVLAADLHGYLDLVQRLADRLPAYLSAQATHSRLGSNGQA